MPIKGSLPRTKKEYFANRFEEIANKKKEEIRTKYHEIPMVEKDLAAKAKLRSKDQILKKMNQTSYINFRDIFNIDEQIELIKKQNKIIRDKQSALIGKVIQDVKDLQESLWLGEEDTNIINVLKSFEEKSYQ